MAHLSQNTVRNRLLRRLSVEDFALLAPHFEPHEIGKGELLFERDTPIQSAWFLESGIGSSITVSAKGEQVESGLFGRDGFAPVATVLGSDRTASRCLIQLADDCLRIDAERLRDAVDQSASLREVLLRYTQVLSIQTAYTALSNALHPIKERLTRWLLMCHDRIDGNEMLLTHEFLAIMLAVRRPSVTTALHVLEGNGFIRAERGCIRIRDRTRMEEFASGSYGVPEREYERFFGPLADAG